LKPELKFRPGTAFPNVVNFSNLSNLSNL